MKIKILLTTFLLLGLCALTGQEHAALKLASAETVALVGNPAATYCEAVMGYDYDIITSEDGAQSGVCRMPDGEVCSQWDFYAGTCGADFSYCAQQGLRLEAKSDGQDPYAPNYSVCTNPTTRESFPMAEVITEATTCTADLADLSPGAMAGANDITNNKPDLPQAPPSFDWRNENGQNWVTSVKDQVACGGSWAFATLGTLEASENILNNDPTLDHDLAEQHLISPCSFNGNCGNCSSGDSACALTAAVNFGIPDEACMPYTESDSSCTSRCTNWAHRLVFARNVYVDWWPTPSNLKEYISTYGPVTIYIGFGDEKGGSFDGDMYRCTDDSGINHAVIAVGYNDAGQYWILKNSLGTGWGFDGGYFKMGYGECNVANYHASYVDTTVSITPTDHYVPMVFIGSSSDQTTVNNPGFESGQDGSWAESSSSGWDLILNRFDVSIPTHSGNWAVWLGGSNDDISIVSQSIAVNANDAVLHYWYMISTNENTCGNDFATLTVNNMVLRTYELCQTTETGGWIEDSLDLSWFAGQWVRISFKVETDESLHSNFFLDDISFKASREVGEPVLFPGVDAAMPRSE